MKRTRVPMINIPFNVFYIIFPILSVQKIKQLIVRGVLTDSKKKKNHIAGM